MRIIGGEHRGRRLSTPRWKGLRPTSDRLRETLFDITVSLHSYTLINLLLPSASDSISSIP